ncbi:hypothetical protein GE061_001898 [Apolygus lucorum]|uniref:Uncharacterized protein n=1 Tax=Apolygus lucorum TaxID=248454 RepID=A0A8S9X666_APOLU|nr:hypothetical protein GE061_001898 [Apolygus lucorum]
MQVSGGDFRVPQAPPLVSSSTCPPPPAPQMLPPPPPPPPPQHKHRTQHEEPSSSMPDLGKWARPANYHENNDYSICDGILHLQLSSLGERILLSTLSLPKQPTLAAAGLQALLPGLRGGPVRRSGRDDLPTRAAVTRRSP